MSMFFKCIATAVVVLIGIIASVTTMYAQPTLRVGWSIPGEETKYWMMKRSGEFSNLGKSYNIEWIQFQGTAAMAQALAAGALDCASQSPLNVAQGAVKGNLRAYIVAQHIYEKPGGFSVYWAVKDDSTIRAIAGLNGKLISIDMLDSAIYGPMALLLKQNGATPNRVIKIEYPLSEDALRSGRVDAAVMNQPFAGAAEARGGIRKLFALSAAMPNFVHLVEACRTDLEDKHPGLVQSYVRDISTSMRKALADRAETLKVVSEVTKARIDHLDRYLLKDNDFGRDPGAAPNFPAMQKMLDIYADTGVLPKLDVTTFKHPMIFAPLK